MAGPAQRLETWRYTLRAAAPPNRRTRRRALEGFLVRVDGAGHGCVQPWPEFGHAGVDDQLAALRAGRPTRLLERALACAAADGAARRAGRSLFDAAAAPVLSHATLTAPRAQAPAAAAAGFRVWKLKAGTGDGPLLAELAAAFPAVCFRLDFNGVPAAREVAAMAGRWPAGLRARIDFLEDPCPPDPQAWAALRAAAGIRLAADEAAGLLEPGPAEVVVCKPAWRDPEALAARWPGSELVVTSAMDHPLGQAFAAWVAATRGRSPVHGVQTHHLFEPDAFSERLGPWQPRFRPPGGTGLGFDDLLAGLRWTPV